MQSRWIKFVEINWTPEEKIEEAGSFGGERNAREIKEEGRKRERGAREKGRIIFSVFRREQLGDFAHDVLKRRESRV